MTSPDFGLTNKVALVTGASRGIGQALATGFAGAGAKVICASSREGGCADTVSKITDAGGEATELFADLSDVTAVQALAEKAKGVYGEVNVLVNNGAPSAFFLSPFGWHLRYVRRWPPSHTS